MRHTLYKYLVRPVPLYLLMTLFFIILIIVIPIGSTNMARFEVSTSQYRSLFFVLEIPLAIVWLTAFYTSHRLQQYARSIHPSPESRDYHDLARGCHWLAWGLPVSAIASLLLTALDKQHGQTLTLAIVIGNYINLLFPVIAFSIMSKSTQQLVNRYHRRTSSWWTDRRKQFGLVVVGILYSYLILRNVAPDSFNSTNNTYHLPVWLVVLSLIVPYLYAWFLGLLTALDIITLAQKTPGVLYRQALRLLAAGLIIVIGSLMVVQYLHSFASQSKATFGPIVITAYITYFLSILGFMLVAAGVRKMQRFEEV